MTLRILIKYFFGIVIVVFVLWNRLVRQRGTISWEIPLYYIIVFDFGLVLFFGTLLYLNIKQLLKVQEQSLIFNKLYQIAFIQRLRVLLTEYVFTAPQFLYNDVTKNIRLKSLLELPASYFTAYCYYPKSIIIIFLYSPLILTATIFLYDNLFSKDFRFFFHSLMLLIPLLLMRVWLFILESYSTRRLNHLRIFITVNYMEKEKRYILFLKPINQLPISENFTFEQIQASFPIFCNTWEIYRKVYSFVKHIDFLHKKAEKYIQVYVTLCFFLGWLIKAMTNITVI